MSPALRTVLVCDVVESVRWMQADEAGAVQQWQAFVEAVKSRVIPQFGGRLVKSLGDGLMLEFADTAIAPCVAISPTVPDHAPRAALGAAFAMQAIAANLSIDGNFSLRMGLHHTQVTVGEDDIYGIGVNLCARVAGLAGPGEVMITAEMRDQLTDQLDADLQDMGECFLKHIEAPVRVYRAGPAGQHPILIPQRDYAAPLQAIVAVIPFAARSLAQDNQLAVGEIIADGVIGQLSRTRDLKVISRLSTSVFRNRINTGNMNGVADIESHLGANYVLSGSYIALDKTLIVTAELSETKSNQIVWMDRLQGDIGDLLQLQSELCHTIASATHVAILESEVQAALVKPLPTLNSYSLWLGGISMMHRSSARSFARGKEMLELVNERHNKVSTTHTWLAKWHLFHTGSGMSADPEQDAKLAMSHTRRALSLNPMDAHALATQGLVMCQMMSDAEGGGAVLDQAIAMSSNEPMAWLYKSIWSHMWGNCGQAVIEAERAHALSPVDPINYFFETILANAYAGNMQYQEAIAAAVRSLKINVVHIPTLRVLLLAQVESGLITEAKQTLLKILNLTPDLTISKYRGTNKSISPVRQSMIKAFQQVGLAE